jgi:hypothetical protein
MRRIPEFVANNSCRARASAHRPRMKTTIRLLSLLLFAAVASGDDPYCLIPRDVDTTGQRWNRNTEVRVWIAPSVRESFQSGIYEAVYTWANDPKNTSGVVFTFVAGEPVDGNSVLIFREEALGAQPAQYSMDATTKRATILLNSAIVDPLAAKQTVMHEVGHTYGQLDCWQCEPGTSVMIQRPADLNDTSWPYAPTECDIAGAMTGMGATKTVKDVQLPSEQADNTPTAKCGYITVRLCWPADHCWNIYTDYYYCSY